MNTPMPPVTPKRHVRVVLSTTALLSFMSVSKATALVISELGVAMFFVVGIARSFVGEARAVVRVGSMPAQRTRAGDRC